MFWRKCNTYFYIKRLSKHRRKWWVFSCFVFVVFNQQVVFFQSFLLQTNLTAFISVLQGRSANWIVGVRQFPLEVSIYHSAKPECVQLFHWFFWAWSSVFITHRRVELSVVFYFISTSQEQHNVCRTVPGKNLIRHCEWKVLNITFLLQSICIMGCLSYKVVWYFPAVLKYFGVKLSFFFLSVTLKL